MWLGKIICAIQRFNDIDNAAKYSHAGIITHNTPDDPMSYEALWTNRRQSFFRAYQGQRVLIGRHEAMTFKRYLEGFNGVRHLEGRWYAGHRLLLHIVPPLAKICATGKWAVCSELAAKFLKDAGLIDFWPGVTPDYLADMIRRWVGWTVVFEGVLPATYGRFLEMPAGADYPSEPRHPQPQEVMP
jgi:hypothetical protein